MILDSEESGERYIDKKGFSGDETKTYLVQNQSIRTNRVPIFINEVEFVIAQIKNICGFSARDREEGRDLIQILDALDPGLSIYRCRAVDGS